VDIQAEAEIAFLVDFIYQLEKSSRFLRVEKFHLSPLKKDSPILKARLSITEVLINS
jgi:hypothetical protein